MKTHVLYNPKSNNGNGLGVTKKIETIIKDADIVYDDFTAIEDIDAFIGALPAEDRVVLSGGDGTLNFYVNHTTEETRRHPIGYFASGTGNDFMRDVPEEKDGYAEDISKYLVKLPTVTVNGTKQLFLNGIGFGIDGYCCEEGDRLKTLSDKPVNYTSIAIKGLLFKFSARNATITVDGKAEEFKKTWIAPTMNGRFYGGGMMAAPGQNRLAEKKSLTVMLFHGAGRIPTLMVFPKIFSGEHVLNKMVTVKTGSAINVKFDRPCALQIDGETVLGVTEYTAEIFHS